MVRDTLGRPIRDLRISVTDRCNFRCTYCMPKTVFGRDYEFLPREQLLSFEEITRLARVFARLGVEKIRLTGGEPLLRRDVETLVGMLAAIPGLEVTLTTNGSLLARKATALAAAGLRRVTVSLDSLDDDGLHGDERRRFPRQQGPRGHRGGRVGRALAGQGEHGRQARGERRVDPPDGALLSTAPATSCGSSSSWTSARRTAGGWTTSFPRWRSSSH